MQQFNFEPTKKLLYDLIKFIDANIIEIEDEKTKFHYKQLLGAASVVRRRIKILENNLTKIKISDDLASRIKDLFNKLDFNYQDLIFSANEERILIEMMGLTNHLTYCSKRLRGIIDELSEGVNSDIKNYQTLQEIDDIYHKSKVILNEINKEYEKLSFYRNKIEEQNQRVDELEKKYRKSVANLSFDEEGIREKQSIIENAYEPAKKLLAGIKFLQDEFEEVKTKYETVKVLVDSISSETINLNSDLKNKVTEVDDLILKAKNALGSATTIQLGGHFKDQYDKSRKGAWFWALLGGIFLLGAIALCITTVFFPDAFVQNIKENSGNDLEMHYLLSRLLIAPLFLIGAWFCSTQYIKQKYIIEDYAYKKVLSLSLLSIKSEIEKTGEANTTEFIRAVQSEIIKSPLDSLDRKHLHKELKLLKTVQSEAVKNILTTLKQKKKKDSPKDDSNRG